MMDLNDSPKVTMSVWRNYVPLTKGWHFSLVAMPPERPLKKSVVDERTWQPGWKPQGTFLGWLADGTPLAGAQLPLKSVIQIHDLRGGGRTTFQTDAGTFAWHFVSMPPGVETARAHVIPYDAEPADIAAALACAPPDARWSAEQVASLTTAVAGEELWAGQISADEPPINALRLKRDRAVARARVALPTLDAVATGAIPTLAVQSDGSSDGSEVRIGLGPATAFAAGARAQAIWLCAMIDPEKYDARALATIDDNTTLEDAWLMCRLTGHLPAGAGARLARRLCERKLLGDGFWAAEWIWARPWLGTEGDAFVETLATTPGKHKWGLDRSYADRDRRKALESR